MGKLRGQATLTSNDHRGRGGGGRYQQVDMTMTPPPANRLLNHHGGSLSSADSSILYNTSSHPTSPLLSQRSPMHQKRHQQPLQQPQHPRHTSVNRHGVVVALEDDDLDLLQVSSFLIVNSRCKFQGLNLHLGLKHIPLIC